MEKKIRVYKVRVCHTYKWRKNKKTHRLDDKVILYVDNGGRTIILFL